jgi:multidrug resistance efflux pump
MDHQQSRLFSQALGFVVDVGCISRPSPTVRMSELEQIKAKIAETEAGLATAKSKLAEAELAENEAKVAKYEADVKELRALLIQQQEEENLLLKAGSGNVIIA